MDKESFEMFMHWNNQNDISIIFARAGLFSGFLGFYENMHLIPGFSGSSFPISGFSGFAGLCRHPVLNTINIYHKVNNKTNEIKKT